MIQGNYENILGKISKASGLEKEEIERRIEAKRARLSGLISREGAAQIIAAELGISFDNERLKIDELLPGMRKVNVVGKVIALSPVRSFNRNSKEGKVVNLTIADETSNVKTVLWDINHIELVEKREIVVGKVIEILNAAMRGNELHLGSFSEMKLSDEVLESINTERVVKEKNIIDFETPDSGVSVRAFIVQVFEPRFFNVCPECKKKVGEDSACEIHGKIVPEKRAVINLVIDDGTESIRGVLFHDSISSLGITELENADLLLQQRQNLLGEEMIFCGEVRNNKFFNNSEFIIDEVRKLDLDELIERLEKKE